MTAHTHIPARLLPPLTRPEPHLEDLLDRRPHLGPAAALAGTGVSLSRADELTQAEYGHSYATERRLRRERDKASRGKQRPGGPAPRVTYSYKAKGML